MAKLTKCRDCEHEISKRAKSCPSCGAPQKARTSPVTMLLAIIIFGSVGIAIFSAGSSTSSSGSSGYTTSSSNASSSSNSQPSSNKAMFLASPAKAQAWMERDKSTVEAILKDADSAKFENVYISFMQDSPVTCGKINAKNSFGGYSGFKEFIAAKSAGITVVRGDGQMEDSEFVKVWNVACMDPI
jgi:hypothetical protein